MAAYVQQRGAYFTFGVLQTHQFSLFVNYVFTNLPTHKNVCVTPKINAHRIFSLSWTWVKGKNLNFRTGTFPAEGQGDAPSSCFKFQTVNICPLGVYLVPCYLHLCVFCHWWCSGNFVWSSSFMPKGCLVFLSTGMLSWTLQKKRHWVILV